MKLEAVFLNRVASVARAAGDTIMAIYSRDFTVCEKEDLSPLTEADLAAHSQITETLQLLTPGIPILSEESAETFRGPNAEQQYWLVDPLDGTKEFIKRNGEFTVNIALIENGKPILGVVHSPALGLLYSAANSLGAFKTDSAGKTSPIRVARHALGTPWKVVSSRSHTGDGLNEWLETLGKYEIIPMGSSLKFCLVAEGKAHLYPRFGPTSLWDTAAAQCIVEQAGGKVIDPTGSPLNYQYFGRLLNPYFVASS